MEIARALHLGNNVQTHTSPKADAKREPLAFARTGQAAAVSKDGSLMNRIGDVYRGCEKLGLQPGQQMSITVDGQLMVLRRTQSADAYVLQKPEDAVAAPFNGLHISNESIAKLDMETIAPGKPNFLDGMRRLQALGNAVSAQSSDWHGFKVSN